jgi:DNA-binding transcriptional regulator YbjK
VARRHDPLRRERLIEAALRALARDGVAATSHRTIALEADVPLGSTTYHFAGLDELVQAAFEKHVESMADSFEARLRAAVGPEEAVEALVDAAFEDLTASQEALALTYELYGSAARRPEVRTLTEWWMARAHAALRLHFDAETAEVLDVLLEGYMVHISISRRPPSRDEVRRGFQCVLDGPR